MSPLTFATACMTALPPYASPPSRSSTASCAPVDAPDGTAARPRAPLSSRTSTSSVGLPRESRIWRAWMDSIVGMRRGRLAGSSAIAEPVRGRAQRQLGIDSLAPGEVDEAEQNLPEPDLGG